MSDEPIRVYSGPDRRGALTLSNEQLEIIAEHAAEKAVKKMTDAFFKELGKRVFQMLVWMLGAVLVGLFLWAQSKDLIKW